MTRHPREIACTMSEHLQTCLYEVARNRAICEGDYVALMDLDLINQPLAVGLPPLTPLGHSTLQWVPQPAKTPHLSLVAS